MARVCGKCNQAVNDTAKFCSNCGSDQIVDINPVVGNTNNVASQPTIVSSPNPSVANIDVQTNTVNSQPAVVQETPSVVEFPVGQQSDTSTSQLQSMPEFPSTDTNVVNEQATNPAIMQSPPVINGVIDNNYFNSTANPRHSKKSRKNNNFMWALLGAGGIIILLLVVLIMIILFSNKLGDNANNTNTTKNEEDYIRIGNGSFGYLSVPNNWKVFIDENALNTIQYTDGAGWIVTLFATNTSVIDSKKWATNVANQMYADGVQDIAMGEESVKNYHGYKVFGYYQETNTFLAAWFFEAEDNNTHYIAIEGPDRYGTNYDIINSFNLTE